MRLWHEELLYRLPRQQLLGQHRECCALRGNGWGRNHSTVDYVFTHEPELLFEYHRRVINIMESKGYNVDQLWKKSSYRGKNCPPYEKTKSTLLICLAMCDKVYGEHDDIYYKECLDNLKRKGINI